MQKKKNHFETLSGCTCLLRLQRVSATVMFHQNIVFHRRMAIPGGVSVHEPTDIEQWEVSIDAHKSYARRVRGTPVFPPCSALLGGWFRFQHNFPGFNNFHLADLTPRCHSDWVTGRYLWVSCALHHQASLITGLSSGEHIHWRTGPAVWSAFTWGRCTPSLF